MNVRVLLRGDPYYRQGMPPRPPASRKRFAVPAALAVSMISCGLKPSPSPFDVGVATERCDGGVDDAGMIACTCDCSACQAECPNEGPLPDGGVEQICSCEALA